MRSEDRELIRKNIYIDIDAGVHSCRNFLTIHGEPPQEEHRLDSPIANALIEQIIDQLLEVVDEKTLIYEATRNPPRSIIISNGERSLCDIIPSLVADGDISVGKSTPEYTFLGDAVVDMQSPTPTIRINKYSAKHEFCHQQDRSMMERMAIMVSSDLPKLQPLDRALYNSAFIGYILLHYDGLDYSEQQQVEATVHELINCYLLFLQIYDQPEAIELRKQIVQHTETLETTLKHIAPTSFDAKDAISKILKDEMALIMSHSSTASPAFGSLLPELAPQYVQGVIELYLNLARLCPTLGIDIKDLTHAADIPIPLSKAKRHILAHYMRDPRVTDTPPIVDAAIEPDIIAEVAYEAAHILHTGKNYVHGNSFFPLPEREHQAWQPPHIYHIQLLEFYPRIEELKCKLGDMDKNCPVTPTRLEILELIAPQLLRATELHNTLIDSCQALLERAEAQASPATHTISDANLVKRLIEHFEAETIER